MRQRILILLMLLPLLLFSSAALAEWRVDFESKTVNPNDVGVTVDVTVYWDLPMSGFTVPVVVRQNSPGSFWTGTLPYDTGGNAYWKPYIHNVTWSWEVPWASILEEFRPGVPTGTCDPEGDVGYDGVAPDHFALTGSSSGMMAPPQPGGWVALTFSFDVTGIPGTFEFDTACFSSSLFKIFMIDNASPPINHGFEATFNKGVITIFGETPNEPPVITCPNDTTVYVGDDVVLSVSATDDGQITTPLAMSVEGDDGSPLPPELVFTDNGDNTATLAWTEYCDGIGVHTIRFIANDGELADTCYTTITTEDNTPPVAQCPANIEVGNDPGDCGAIVSFAISATDNCSDTTVTADPPSGSRFPVGTTQVEVIATDAAGNADTCYFDVTVNDTEAPVAECSDDVFADNDPGECGAVVNFNIGVTDNCDGATVVADPPPESFFDVGVTQVEVVAVDAAGIADTCYFDVTVTDIEAPELTCPANMTVDVDTDECYATVIYDATATDNCPGDPTITFDPPSGSTFNEGTTTQVEVIATDAVGNADTCYFDVTVNSVPIQLVATPPSITFNWQIGDSYPADQMVDITNEGCGEVAFTMWDGDPSWLSVSQTGSTTPATLTLSLKDLDLLTPGVYTTDIEISEDNGTTAKGAPLLVPVTLNVIGEDNLPPAITCPNDTTNYVDNELVLTITATDPNGDALTMSAENDDGSPLPEHVVFTDNGEGIATMTSTPPCDGIGTHTVRFIASDGELADSCYVTITVEDNTPPELTCPANMSVGTDAGECYATVTYSAAATDNCSDPGDIVITYDPLSGSQFTQGSPTTVTVTATDESQNVQTCTFTVTVEDDENPVALCDGDMTVEDDGSGSGAVVHFQYDATDNCPGVMVDSYPVSGSFFPTGTTTVTVAAADVAGNVDTCWFDVTVNPPAEPVIILVDPNNANQGDALTVHITGLNTCFEQGSSTVTVVELVQNGLTILGTDVIVYSSTELDVDFAIPGGAPLGLYDVAVGVSGGCGVVVLEDGFTVNSGGPLQICGTVVSDDPNGFSRGFPGGLPGHVEVWDSYPDGEVVGETTAGPDGSFCVGVPEGEYDVRVCLMGYCAAVIEGVTAPEADLIVVLTAIPDPQVTPYVADYWGTGATLYGYSLLPGDAILAYDPDDNFCGVAYVVAGGEYLIHVYGDDPKTTDPDQDEGAVDGDVITFMLNCACPLDAENLWVNHCSYEEDLAFECVRELEIPLCGTWTLISYNVLVEHQDLDSVLNSIAGLYERVISSICDTGAVTWEAGRPPELNDLNWLDNEHGFWLYAPGADVLTISGLPIEPDTPIELCDGWNVISYLPNDPDELAHAFGSIAGEYEYVIGFDCESGVKTLDPKRPAHLNDLTCLYPGFGYWVKMFNAATLTYPTSGYACSGLTIMPKPVNLTRLLTPTPWSCDFWSAGDPDGPAAGSIVTVRDESDNICGQGMVMAEGAFLLHVYGDDPNTPAADEGATAGSILSFEIDGVPCQIAGSDLWVERGSFEISLTRSGSGVATPKMYMLNQNYPNPFNAQTAISFALPTASSWSIRIYDITGRLVDQIDGQSGAGLVTTHWYAGEAPSGIYFYRLAAGEFTQTRKMTLMK